MLIILFLVGLVGCMRQIKINDLRIEPRYVINTERVVGEVALDNCQFVDPCKRPNTCEHGGKCSVKEDRITCDCTDTGYIGKNCHFGKKIKKILKIISKIVPGQQFEKKCCCFFSQLNTEKLVKS